MAIVLTGTQVDANSIKIVDKVPNVVNYQTDTINNYLFDNEGNFLQTRTQRVIDETSLFGDALATSYSAFFETDNTALGKFEYNANGWFSVMSTDFEISGLGNYTREQGFAYTRSLESTTALTMQATERSARYTIDTVDNQTTIIANKLTKWLDKLFQDHLIPELDAYRFSGAYSAIASANSGGTVVEGAYVGTPAEIGVKLVADIQTALDKLAFTRVKGMLGSSAKYLILLDEKYKRSLKAYVNEVVIPEAQATYEVLGFPNTKPYNVGWQGLFEFEGAKIQYVPSHLLKTSYVFNAGVTDKSKFPVKPPSEEIGANDNDGGFTVSPTAKDIAFMIIPQINNNWAFHAHKFYQTVLMSAPSAESSDSYTCAYRLIHGLVAITPFLPFTYVYITAKTGK